MDENNGAKLRKCAPDCIVCAKEQRLQLLATKLESRGLDARLIACGVRDDGHHYVLVAVVNTAAAQRGTFYVAHDGTAHWDFPGSDLYGDEAIGRMVDEAITALRAGIRLPQRKPHDQQPS